MTTTVKVFRSTETGAPELKGNAAGSLIAVLDACLVTGYGGGTPDSITRSGSTATVGLTGHTCTEGDVVLIAGAEQSEYNGEAAIFNVTADAFDIAVTGTPATPATGTITVKKAPAGWTKPYTGTNKAAFRMGAGSQAYLRIDDSPAQFPRVVGYSSMTDVDTGSNPFPNAAQFSGGLYWCRSSANDANAREWMVIANDRFLHLWINTNGINTAGNYQFFGDIVSYVSGDANQAILVGNSAGNYYSSYSTEVTALNGATPANYMPAPFNQIPGSVNVGKHIDNVKAGTPGNLGRGGTNGLPYPNPADGGMYLSPVWVHEPGTRTLRGHIPGLWAICTATTRPIGHQNLVEGAGALAGRKFLALYCMRYNNGDDAMPLIETSSTWYA